MNENDIDRYFWRTGQRWSGDSRSTTRAVRGPRTHSRMIVVVGLSFIATVVGLLLLR